MSSFRHSPPSANPGYLAMRLRCLASAYTQGAPIGGQSPGLHDPMQRMVCRSCLGCEHSAKPHLFRRKSLREGEVPARSDTGISRSWRRFVAGSIGTGPGWKICVARITKNGYMTLTDWEFSVATQFIPVGPGGFTVRPGRNFFRTSPEPLQVGA